MPKVINKEMISKKQQEIIAEQEKANMMLELADKEARIKELEIQNANILLELATIKGGV